MPIDASIPLGIKPVQIESPLNQLGQVLTVQSAQNQNALAQYGLARAQRQDDETNKLAQLMSGGGVDLSTPEGQAKAYGVAPTQAAGYIKGMLENKNIQAQTGQRTAQGDKDRVEAENKTISVYRDASQSITDPQSAIDFVTHMHSDPRLANSPIAQVPLEKAIAQIPQDPAQLAAWKQQFALGATKFMELNKPQTTVVNAGGSSQVLQTPGLGGQPQLVGTVAHTISPDAQLQANTSTANTRAMIAKDYAVAGLNQDGSSTGANDSMVDAIGQYKVAPPNGMALRNPRMQQILAEVTQKYPDFDATAYGARQTAAKAFSTGPQAQQVQAGNTALNHLDTIEQLATAQKNGNVQLFNKIANTIGAQLGQPAPTNLKAAITMVAPEISKAVIGSGGTGGERDQAAAMLNPNASPDQMLGAVGTIKELFGGRLSETARTYQRATGRKDFADTFLSPAAQRVLAARTQPTAGAAPGMPDTSAIDAELARRAGKK